MWGGLQLANRPSSVLLTVLVTEAYFTLSDQQKSTDDVTIRHVASAIRNRLEQNAVVENPANRQENLNRLNTQDLIDFLSGLQTLTGIADAALASVSEFEAAFYWTGAFNHFFPAPDTEAAGNALVQAAFIPDVDVQARPKDSQVMIPGMNAIGPIPKGCVVSFSLRNALQLPPGSQIRWFVRNEGEEAELTNDLGHVAGTGLRVERDSKYKGTHYMDVVVLSALGQVIGFRRVPVQVSGAVMPRRNPKRPGYTRFAARR